jgi:hypothetical protein
MTAGIADNDHGYVGYRKPAILTVSHENRYDVCPYVPGSWEKRGRRRRLVYTLRLEAAGSPRERRMQELVLPDPTSYDNTFGL